MKPILSLLLSTGLAMAHHGQDFFVTLDARVPAKGGFSAFATAAAGEDDFSLESGLIAGLGAGFAAGSPMQVPPSPPGFPPLRRC